MLSAKSSVRASLISCGHAHYNPLVEKADLKIKKDKNLVTDGNDSKKKAKRIAVCAKSSPWQCCSWRVRPSRSCLFRPTRCDTVFSNQREKKSCFLSMVPYVLLYLRRLAPMRNPALPGYIDERCKRQSHAVCEVRRRHYLEVRCANEYSIGGMKSSNVNSSVHAYTACQ